WLSRHHIAYQLFLEVKNEVGPGGCDPTNTHVCYWKDRGGIGYHSVDGNGNLHRFQTVQRSGQMALVADIVEKAINDGAKFGKGIIEKSAFNLKNEDGWILRVIHYLMRWIQHKWYVDSYGGITQSNHALPPINVTPKFRSKYQRPLIPPGLEQPVATPIQPFYTLHGFLVEYMSLLPPSPMLRVGYVSSDFKDCPLAHSMQSVFGMHDRDKSLVFATRPAPIQVTHMGFASSLGGLWYVKVNEHVCPESQTSDYQFWSKSCDLLGEVDPEEDDKN
ncbi:20345_t:CDS:2, partial [Dentiscutata erythropus]